MKRYFIPLTINTIFIVGAVISVFLGYIVMFGGFLRSDFAFGLGIVIVIMGIGISRISCELISIIFEINQSLVEIREEIRNIKKLGNQEDRKLGN